MRPDLLIGIGNPLRGDDGVGAVLLGELACEREKGGAPAADLRVVHQLTPELALAVAAAGRVLFVDAWASPAGDGPWIEPLNSATRTSAHGAPGSHGLDPLDLVAVAEALYGWLGEAALLRVPAYAFPHGSGFSPSLRRVLPRARQLMRQWLIRPCGDGDNAESLAMARGVGL